MWIRDFQIKVVENTSQTKHQKTRVEQNQTEKVRKISQIMDVSNFKNIGLSHKNWQRQCTWTSVRPFEVYSNDAPAKFQ